jgi:hypothetical protein
MGHSRPRTAFHRIVALQLVPECFAKAGISGVEPATPNSRTSGIRRPELLTTDCTATTSKRRSNTYNEFSTRAKTDGASTYVSVAPKTLVGLPAPSASQSSVFFEQQWLAAPFAAALWALIRTRVIPWQGSVQVTFPLTSLND